MTTIPEQRTVTTETAALTVTLGPDDVVDVFAGPGGWDTGARLAGYLGRLLGIEWDPDACATATAAGHDRLLADVSAVEPVLLGAWIAGALGSPPCQAWSRAGKALGLKDQPRIWAHVRAVERAGHWIPYPRDGWHDERSPLVLEALRWVLLCRPRWFAFEQVPDVLPFWRELARVLRAFGYNTAAYELTAEEYGVPQTRRRAFLIGSVDAQVTPPAPTHQRYEPGAPAAPGAADLFGEAVLPWVSMGEALGWHPAALVGFPRRADTPASKTGDDDHRVIEIDGARYRARDLRAAELPAQAVTEKVRSWEVWTGNNTMRHSRAGSRAGAGGVVGYSRPVTDPAPTLDEPAATIFCSRPGNLRWTSERPATTVQGDARIAPPGHRARERGERQFTEGTVRVSVAEAGILQSFPADYPWQGTKTAQYRQVGDAVPPLLAAAILRPLLAASTERSDQECP